MEHERPQYTFFFRLQMSGVEGTPSTATALVLDNSEASKHYMASEQEPYRA